MINQEIIGIIAGILSFSAYFLYIITTIFGKTKPNRVTWWILTFVGLMIAFSYYSSGARTTIWIALSYVLGPFVTAILSLKYGEGNKLGKLDKFCLGVSIISIFVWYISESALLALLMNIFLDFIGLLPTIKKSYFRPLGEDRVAWTLEFIASFLNLFAIERWIFSIFFYPIYLVTINGVVILLLYKPILKNKINYDAESGKRI